MGCSLKSQVYSISIYGRKSDHGRIGSSPYPFHKQPLLIANIAVGIDISPAKEKSFDEWLFYFIQSAFSSPTNNPDYIPSQKIAEYIRYLCYDGIRYGSSLHEGGFALTVFEISKCEAVSSTDLRLEKNIISMHPALGVQNIDDHFEYIVENEPMMLDKRMEEWSRRKIDFSGS